MKLAATPIDQQGLEVADGVVLNGQVVNVASSKRDVRDLAQHCFSGVNMALGEGARDHFSIRGYDALNDFYRNGLRDGGNVQAYRSLQNVERIEVVKGVAGALYGRGSAGGLINLVSKKADGHAVANFSVSTGSFSQQRVSADLGDKLTENVKVYSDGLLGNSGTATSGNSLLT